MQYCSGLMVNILISDMTENDFQALGRFGCIAAQPAARGPHPLAAAPALPAAALRVGPRARVPAARPSTTTTSAAAARTAPLAGPRVPGQPGREPRVRQQAAAATPAPAEARRRILQVKYSLFC